MYMYMEPVSRLECDEMGSLGGMGRPWNAMTRDDTSQTETCQVWGHVTTQSRLK